MNARMEAPVIELPWWLGYVNALAWAGTCLALLVAAYFFWRIHMLRRRSEMRSEQWESLASAIDQALVARECHQLQIKMLILVHLARQHEFQFGDAQLLADVNAVLARRIVARELGVFNRSSQHLQDEVLRRPVEYALCSDSALSPQVVAGPTAFEGKGVARPVPGAQEKRWGQEGPGSLGVVRVEALQQEVPYRSQEERVLLELSNELQHILSCPQH